MEGLHFIAGISLVALLLVGLWHCAVWVWYATDPLWLIRSKLGYWWRWVHWWCDCRWVELQSRGTVRYEDVDETEEVWDDTPYTADTKPLVLPLALPVVAMPRKGYIYTYEGHNFGFSLEDGHGGIVGKSGSGKGNLIQLICLYVLRMGKTVAELVVLDRKAGLDYAPFVGLAGFTLYRGRGKGDSDRILSGLQTIEVEMERRLELMFASKKRNIKEYNKIAAEPLPYVVVVCDELADFTDVHKSYIETMVAMYRATGLVLVVATQHPLAKHLSSTIQGNLSWRFICKVANKRLNLVATGAATNDEIEIDPTLVAKGEAILRDEDRWLLVQVPLLTEAWRDSLIDNLPKETDRKSVV